VKRPREAALAAECRSKVTFEIETVGGAVKLTVIHDDSNPAAPCDPWSAALPGPGRDESHPATSPT
jgi:hypothetical protein